MISNNTCDTDASHCKFSLQCDNKMACRVEVKCLSYDSRTLCSNFNKQKILLVALIKFAFIKMILDKQNRKICNLGYNYSFKFRKYF